MIDRLKDYKGFQIWKLTIFEVRDSNCAGEETSASLSQAKKWINKNKKECEGK